LPGILEQLCGFKTHTPWFSLRVYVCVRGMSTEDLQSKGIPQTTKSYKITQHTHSNRNQINVVMDERVKKNHGSVQITTYIYIHMILFISVCKTHAQGPVCVCVCCFCFNYILYEVQIRYRSDSRASSSATVLKLFIASAPIRGANNVFVAFLPKTTPRRW